MAIAQVTVDELKEENGLTPTAQTALGSLASGDWGYVATTGTFGAYFKMPEVHDKYIIEIHNTDSSNANTVCIRAGDHEVRKADLTFASIPANGIKLVQVEGAAHKWLSGAHAGCVLITGADADVKIRVFKVR